MRGTRVTILVGRKPDDDGTFISFVRELPGCVSWGFSQQEAIENAKLAARLYVEHLAEQKKHIAAEPPVELENAELDSAEYLVPT